MFVKKQNREWVICCKDRFIKRELREHKDWFLIKAEETPNDNIRASSISVGSLILPNSFIGKKIRLKVEIIDET